MSVDGLTQFVSSYLSAYPYLTLFVLAFIEGPVVALLAGTLASLGYFNIYILAVFFFVRDLGLDVIYYYLGQYAGETTYGKRMLKKIGLTAEHLKEVREAWEQKAGRTMFIGKISYGIAPAFIFAAGAVRMSFKRFISYGALVAIIQYWGLLFVGYFLGNTFGTSITSWINNLHLILGAVGLVLAGYYLLTFYMRKKLIKDDARFHNHSV